MPEFEVRNIATQKTMNIIEGKRNADRWAKLFNDKFGKVWLEVQPFISRKSK